MPRDEVQRLVGGATWGGADMLSPAVHELYTALECTAVANALLNRQSVQANGDFWFRAAVSEDILPGDMSWGYEFHQDSYNYGGSLAHPPGEAPCEVLSLWIPLVDVDGSSGVTTQQSPP